VNAERTRKAVARAMAAGGNLEEGPRMRKAMEDERIHKHQEALVSVTFRGNPLNIPGTFREHSEHIQGTFSAHLGDIQCTQCKFREHSVRIQGAFSAHAGNLQCTFREQSVHVDAKNWSSQDAAQRGD
jgi:hypothetical protein